MSDSHIPLAEKIRPQSLEEFIGQKHLVGKEGILRKLIAKDKIPSLIFWGPPGSGKTTLAQIIANSTGSYFINRSAVTTTLADVRKAVQQAKQRLSAYDRKTIFFLDEIHRFNKAQQDAFLPHVEDGTIILIGATTENPSFEVIGPLLSRSRVFMLYPLNKTQIKKIIKKGLRFLGLTIDKKAEEYLAEASSGDARIALNAIEISHQLIKPKKKVTLKVVEKAFQKKSLTLQHH